MVRSSKTVDSLLVVILFGHLIGIGVHAIVKSDVIRSVLKANPSIEL
jgi:hypothetical protein